MQVKDNVTGALARMFVVAGPEQRTALAPQFLSRLPLTEDHAEWKIVLTAIELLVQQGNEQVWTILRCFFERNEQSIRKHTNNSR